jgi:dTDP-glucose 4,6-dehydratase
MSWQPRSLLITGGAGFIGANFVHCTRRWHPECKMVVLDALSYAGNRANLEGIPEDGRFAFVHGDIRDQALVTELLRGHAIDAVVHFAAESHVDRSIAGPEAFVDTNIVGTHTLLTACRSVWLAGPEPLPHRFQHVSTDEVYGSLGPSDPAFTETTAYAPNSPYSASKAAADHLVRAYQHTFGLSTAITNCSNNYGPWQYPEKLIPVMIMKILAGEPLPVYGDGRNVRDWLYVEDHCSGIDRVLRAGRPGQTYNIGGGTEIENIELVRRLCAVADAAFAADPGLRERYPDCPAARGEPTLSLLSYVQDRPGHDRRYAINAGKIRAELGHVPQMDFSEGLRATFHWYLDHAAWWQR